MKDEDPNHSSSSTTGSATTHATNDSMNDSVNKSNNNDTNKKSINTISNANSKNLDNKTNKATNKSISIQKIVKKPNTLQTINVQATREVAIEPKPTITAVTENKSSKTASFTSKTITATIQAKPSNTTSNSTKQSQQIIVVQPQPMPIAYPDSYKPAIVHALFNPNRIVIDPARPLSDIPEPASRFPTYLLQLDDESVEQVQPAYASAKSNKHIDMLNSKTTHDNHWYKTEDSVSKWDLIQSTALADHIQLLEAGELAKFPHSFYNNNYNSIKPPLLSSLADMEMVAMSDILAIITANPTLTRQGLAMKSSNSTPSKSNKNRAVIEKASKSINKTEIQNTDFADDWEVILYPQRFDEATTLFHTDIMACSIAKHVLSQCDKRKSINTKLSINDITNAVRSYQLSQCKELPAMREQLRRTGIYAGHIIIASILLDLNMQVNTDEVDTDLSKNIKLNKVSLNLSSRSALFARYPILSSYYINGWQ